MWIAFRLILAIIGFAIRQLSRGAKKADDGMFEGIPYFEKVRQTKKGIKSFTIGMERKSPTWLRCHAESKADRFFKWLGIANEVQTGDEKFDDRVYVTCDHPYIQALLSEDAELRESIRWVFDEGYKRVVFNGTTVSIERDADYRPHQRDFQLLKRIHTASKRLENEMPSRFGDPFLWKAFLVEGIIWSIAGYAIGAVVQMIVTDQDVHLSRMAVVRMGIYVAAAVFIVLIGLIALGMRGSSRGHRVIVESAVLLLFALPASAIQLVGDTNRALDDKPPIITKRTINQCEERVHVRRNRRHHETSRWYSYHLWLDPPSGEVEDPDAPPQPQVQVPQTIEVTSSLCNPPGSDGTVLLTIGQGRWGLPWYRQIQVGDAVWTSPL